MANEVVESKKENVFLNNLSKLADPDNFQKYILGTKKNGSYRAVYDVVKDYTKPKKKDKKGKKGKKRNKKTSFSLYLDTKNSKKRRKKDSKKHWHI